MKLIKEDGNNNVLEGATFGLYAKENIELNGYVFYKKGEEIERKITGKDGIIEFENLYLGKYEIKELEAPEGYNLLEEKVNFEVTNESLEHEFTIENTKKIEEKDPTKDDPEKEDPPKEDPEKETPPKEDPIKESQSKEEPKTTAPTALPQTGKATNLVLLTAIIDFLSISVVFYKKYKNLI